MSKLRFIIYRSDLKNLQARQKKAKKYQLHGIALSINGHILNAINIVSG